MSIHRSLFIKSSLKRNRNVLTRDERIAVLLKEGKWKEGEPVFHLPKVKGEAKIKKVKVKAAAKKEEAATEEKVETKA